MFAMKAGLQYTAILGKKSEKNFRKRSAKSAIYSVQKHFHATLKLLRKLKNSNTQAIVILANI